MKRAITAIPGKKAGEWSLVLLAMNIPHILEEHGGISDISVDENFIEEAQRQIDLYEQENTGESSLQFEQVSPLISVFTIFIALFIFQTYLYQSGSYDLWLKAGNSSNFDIRNGEIWRIFTALTLHAGLIHFLSNAFMGGVIFYSLFSMTGTGTGLFLSIMAGAAGNYATALIIPVEYHSIGASGSIFGAFGILASFRITRGASAAGKPDWKPAAAALAFLGLFGTAEGSDFFGHLFSLIAGFILGFPSAAIMPEEKLPPVKARVIFTLLSSAIIAIAWIKALDRL
jgi:membrane associated rhomboid family serine protease